LYAGGRVRLTRRVIFLNWSGETLIDLARQPHAVLKGDGLIDYHRETTIIYG